MTLVGVGSRSSVGAGLARDGAHRGHSDKPRRLHREQARSHNDPDAVCQVLVLSLVHKRVLRRAILAGRSSTVNRVSITALAG